jgi:hypothetical protein
MAWHLLIGDASTLRGMPNPEIAGTLGVLPSANKAWHRAGMLTNPKADAHPAL